MADHTDRTLPPVWAVLHDLAWSAGPPMLLTILLLLMTGTL